MSKSLRQVVAYSVFFLICLLVHFLLMRFLFESDADFTKIYVFTGIVCVLTLFLIAEVNAFFHKYLGFIFIGIIALKLIAAKVFIDKSEMMDENQYKYSFIGLYLISLVLITLFSAKLLLRPEK